MVFFDIVRIFRFDVCLSCVCVCVLARVCLGVSAFVSAGVHALLFMKRHYVNTFVYMLFSLLTLVSVCMCACLRVCMRLREHAAVDATEMSGFWTGKLL